VLQDKMMIQLGRTALVTGRLDPQAMEKGLRCLDEFRRMALARRVERTLAVATSAIREAENGAEFLRRAREESGLSVRVISGREEARLIHLAVSRHVELQSEKALLIDIGGGSVELTVGDSSRIHYATSLKLGFLRLHGRFVTSNPMNRREARTLNAFVHDSLQHSLASIRRHNPRRVIGTSGSITALLRLVEQRRAGSTDGVGLPNVVTRDEIRKILADLSAVPSVERARKFDLDPLRSEYLPTALLCLDKMLEGAGVGEITVCPVALREGLIYDLAASAPSATAVPVVSNDLRLQAVIDLAGRCDYPAEHSHHVAHLASQVFNQTLPLHGLGENEARMLHFASILHDIGYHIGYAKHHKHAYYLVMNCDLRAFSPEERSILANIVRYHRRALPKTSHAAFAALPSKARKTVKTLTAILRIADGLDMSHFSLVDEVKCTMGKKKVHFQLFTNAVHSKVELDLWAAQNHARFFEKLFDVETSFSAKKKVRGPALSVPATDRMA
jgi:exopolyphosphatase/guanosine-5'-triphosphate,3'-diphosphate pyrophosphatase